MLEYAAQSWKNYTSHLMWEILLVEAASGGWGPWRGKEKKEMQARGWVFYPGLATWDLGNTCTKGCEVGAVATDTEAALYSRDAMSHRWVQELAIKNFQLSNDEADANTKLHSNETVLTAYK